MRSYHVISPRVLDPGIGMNGGVAVAVLLDGPLVTRIVWDIKYRNKIKAHDHYFAQSGLVFQPF